MFLGNGRRHPGFQAMAEGIQVFRQWQKTFRFSVNGRKHPGFQAMAEDIQVFMLLQETTFEGLVGHSPPWRGFPAWVVELCVNWSPSLITNHQSITITNSQSPITCWTSSWPSLARARCPGRTEPALLLPDQNNDLRTTFILKMVMTLKQL